MDNYEVLVHIAAPSGFRDDKRYRAQADAIVKFEAATVTNVYRGSEEAEQAGEESGIDETIASFDITRRAERNRERDTCTAAQSASFVHDRWLACF
jgi:hypothetical protein